MSNPNLGSKGIVARTVRWYAEELDDSPSSALNPIPPPTTATVAQQVGAQGEQTPRHEQVANAQTWYPFTEDDVDGAPPIVSVFDPAPFTGARQVSDPSERRSNWQSYPPPVDLVGVRESPPDIAPSVQLVADWDASGQQDNPTTQNWYQPETEELGAVPIAGAPFVPTTFTGALHQQPDPTEQRANGATWYQAGDPVDGPLRASRYSVADNPSVIDPLFSYPRVVQAGGPVSHWRLDEPFNAAVGSGLTAGWYTAHDYVGFGGAGNGETREGQWSGIPVSVKPGLITGDTDGAAGFDGASYIRVQQGDWISSFGTGDFSVEFWLQTTTPSTYILSQGTVATGWWVGLDAVGRPTLVIAGTGMTSPRVVTDGVRHHIFWTRDASGQFTCYVDGARQGTASLPGLDATASGDFVIGNLADLSGGYFNGTLDELALYDSILPLATIGTHYVTGTQGWAPLIQAPDTSEQRAWAQTWFSPDLPAEGLVPPTAVAFDPATMDWGLDTQSDRSTQPVWHAPDAYSGPESPIPAPTVATVAQQAGLWQDQSGQQDRSIQPTWFTPELDTFAQYPTVPVAPYNPAVQMPWLLADEYLQRRDFTPDSVQASFEGTLQPWLFTTGSPAPPGVAPAVLIEAETGDIFLSIGGNLIVNATNG